MIDRVTVWDGLTLEQYAVMINAVEEAYLNNVMDEYGMRLRWAKTGNCRHPSDLAEDAKGQLIPHFAAVVADLVDRGWVEIREPFTGRWDDAAPMSPAQQDAALHDPATCEPRDHPIEADFMEPGWLACGQCSSPAHL